MTSMDNVDRDCRTTFRPTTLEGRHGRMCGENLGGHYGLVT